MPGQRRLDGHLVRRQVARDLVGHEHAELAEQVAEGRRARALHAHQGQLVLHERVIDDVDLTGHQRALLLDDIVTSTALTSRSRRCRRRMGAAPRRRSSASCRPATQVPPSRMRRQRQIASGRGQPLAHQRRQPIEQRHRERAPLHHHLVAGTVRLAHHRVVPRHQHARVHEQPAVAILGQPGERVERRDVETRGLPAARSASRSATARACAAARDRRRDRCRRPPGGARRRPG